MALSSVFDSLPCKLTLNYNNFRYGQDSIKITDTVSTVIFGEGHMDEDPLFVDSGQADFHLLDSSPAIGAARAAIEVEGVWYYSPPFDMEGNLRPGPSGSHPDMGAYENMNARPVGIREDHQAGLNDFTLQIYPNPFRHSVNIEFNLAEQSHVMVEIFNLLGENVMVLISQICIPGIHRVIWNPTHLENNIYFYRIRMESVSNQVFIKTGQILKIE
jgi:hypothetical protein